MQFDIRGRRVHVTPMLCYPFEGRLHFVLSRPVPRGTGGDLYGPKLDPDWRKLEIKSCGQLHHLELMKSCGRSVARSITRSMMTGTACSG